MCILCHCALPVYRVVLTAFTRKVKLCPQMESKEFALSLFIYTVERTQDSTIFPLDDGVSHKSNGKDMSGSTRGKVIIPGSVSDSQAG